MDLKEFLEKYRDGATIAGEIQSDPVTISQVDVNSIPVSQAVDYEALTAGDEHPMEVVVEIPASKSKRGWNYTVEAIKSIVNQVADRTAAGFKGHQKAENVSTEFLDPATHWIGAIYDESKQAGFFRGYVDPKEKDLRRWIKSKRIKEVSIFGKMQLKKVAGETQVVDCDLLSIDWTPLGRPGMPTQLIDVQIKGEMKEDEEPMDKEQLLAELKAKLDAGEITPEEFAALIPEDKKGDDDDEKGNDNDTNRIPENLEHLLSQLGITAESSQEEIDAALEKLKADPEGGEDKTQEELIDEVIKEKIPNNEAAQKLAAEIFHFEGTDKEAIVGEMDTYLGKESIKNVFDTLMTDQSFGGGKDNRNSKKSTNVRKVKRSIGY